MGLLDWLTDIGGGGGMSPSDPMGNSMGPSAPPPVPAPAATQPMPPVQATGADAQPVAAPPLAPPDGGNLPQPLPPGTPPPPVPMPQPRPPGADASSPLPSPSPATPPGAPMSLAPSAPGPTTPASVPGQTALGRALGITPDQAGAQGRQIMGGIGAGLKSVGQNWNKPAAAAFAGSAGSAIEGGAARGDKEYDQKTKYLAAATAALAQGDKATYNTNYTAYLAAKLKNDTDKAADSDASKKTKGGAWNKPDTQRYTDAMNSLQKDPDVKTAMDKFKAVSRGGTPEEIAAAQKEVTDVTAKKRIEYLAGQHLTAEDVDKFMKNPPGTAGSPHVVTSKEDFEKTVQPGQYYKNPADGKIYIRKGPGEAMQGGTPAPTAPGAAPASAAPAAPGPMPGTGASTPAKPTDPDDDED